MNYLYDANLKKNDEDFIKEINSNAISVNDELNDKPLKVYNPALFQIEMIIKFF